MELVVLLMMDCQVIEVEEEEQVQEKMVKGPPLEEEMVGVVLK